jgi:endonuclease-3 related protein
MFINERLFAHYGPRQWWPAETPFEVMVGAVLTQNTAWGNARKAIESLASHGLLTAEAMASVPLGTLASLIKPSGYFNVKARRLKALVDFVLSRGRGGDNPDILGLPMGRLREELLAVTGVGPETADSIILYAANQPSFVVDAYTRRLLSRHSLALGAEPYGAIRDWFMFHLPQDASLYNEYHALVVTACHQQCSPRRPSCQSCPLGDDPLLDPGPQLKPSLLA